MVGISAVQSLNIRVISSFGTRRLAEIKKMTLVFAKPVHRQI